MLQNNANTQTTAEYGVYHDHRPVFLVFWHAEVRLLAVNRAAEAQVWVMRFAGIRPQKSHEEMCEDSRGHPVGPRRVLD